VIVGNRAATNSVIDVEHWGLGLWSVCNTVVFNGADAFSFLYWEGNDGVQSMEVRNNIFGANSG
jgi:hypothetical protein